MAGQRDSRLISPKSVQLTGSTSAISLIREDGPIAEVSEEVWNATIAVNLTGTFLCCKYAILIMVKNKKGSIINVSSRVALTSGKNNNAYSASKGGILSLTRSIAVSYAA